MGGISSLLAGILEGAAGLPPARAEALGPAEWPLRAWVGFFLYILVFLLVVIGLYRMAVSDLPSEEEGGRKPGEPAPGPAKDPKP